MFESTRKFGHPGWLVAAFVAGVMLAQRLAELPTPYWLCVLPLLAAFCYYRPRAAWMVALLLGIFWSSTLAGFRLKHSLAPELIGQDLLVSGYVVGIPEPDQRRLHFDFVVERQLEHAVALSLPLKVSLNWYKNQSKTWPDLRTGQRWQLKVRLKPAAGLMNPGGFDYEALLYSRNVRATGYIRQHGDNRLLAEAPPWSAARLRSDLLRRMLELSDGLRNQGVLLALTLGYRGRISDADWNLLLQTGTNHLVAISGLHIGMVAGLFYALALFGGRLLCRFGIRSGKPLQVRATIVSWLAAFVYAWLAGFALPTQRALIMLSVVMLAMLLFRPLRPLWALTVALFAVLLFDPFAVNHAGFWLSFCAVALILYGVIGRRRSNGSSRMISVLARWTSIQLWLVLGLAPLTLFWFGGTAVMAAAANLIAIPLIGTVTVPLALAALLTVSVWPAAAAYLLQGADISLDLLWPVLQAMMQLPMARWEQALPPLWTILPALLGALWLLAPRGLPARWIGICGLLPMLFYAPARPADGEFDLTVLDVGQGTAVVVRTARHNLLYDSGPKTGVRFDAGRLVVLPFMRQRGIKRLHTMVISHGDNDHIGGAETILASMPVDAVISSVPDKIAGYQASRCVAGQHWRWDGVEFNILHPDQNRRWRGNNSSCVLSIGNSRSRLLLSGDIERPAERALVATATLSAVNLLIAPHHGSRSSSSFEFLKALQPQQVVFTAGLFNRYGFPKSDIVQRYRDIGSRVYITGTLGAIDFASQDQEIKYLDNYRNAAGRYWHYRPGF